MNELYVSLTYRSLPNLSRKENIISVSHQFIKRISIDTCLKFNPIETSFISQFQNYFFKN